ncbi:MAG TPA: DUF5689 domain-containing protein [Bacteroidales bacterium]|nr:DUF5689 domain-containing protein [Bacteroidales bacterium]HPT11127.1 DUF5689 domain-containing protein [Bacteroidales bacterium]
MKKTIYILMLAVLLVTFLPSCDYNHETPPPVVDFTYGTIVTIQQVKALYNDQLAIPDYTQRYPVQITSDWALKGVITASDKMDGNLYKEAYVQDATGGLRMVFNSTGSLSIGDSVIINVKDLYIGDYGNFWQLGDTPYAESDGDIRVAGMNMDKQILKISVGNKTRPDTITIAQAKTAAYLGKLVTLKDVQFTDDMNGVTWADAKNQITENRDLTDCAGKAIVVRTSGYALFAGDLLPVKKGYLTGIVTIYNGTYQFIIRDYREVNMTQLRCGEVEQILGTPVETLSQDFTGYTAESTIYVTGWQNLSQAGGRTWIAKLFDGNTYAQATAYKSTASSVISWFITRPVTISTQKILSFQSAMAYWTHATTDTPLEVYYSTDYNGTNLTTATWTKITTATLPTSTGTNYAFVNSGNINLPVEAGKSCVIGFKYSGSSSKTTSICLDNINITAAK